LLGVDSPTWLRIWDAGFKNIILGLNCSWLILKVGRQLLRGQKRTQALLAAKVLFVFFQILWKLATWMFKAMFMLLGYFYWK
jgi:hypothetical protein